MENDDQELLRDLFALVGKVFSKATSGMTRDQCVTVCEGVKASRVAVHLNVTIHNELTARLEISHGGVYQSLLEIIGVPGEFYFGEVSPNATKN